MSSTQHAPELTYLRALRDNVHELLKAFPPAAIETKLQKIELALTDRIGKLEGMRIEKEVRDEVDRDFYTTGPPPLGPDRNPDQVVVW